MPLTPAMKPGEELFDLIKGSEGVELKAYPDPGTGGKPWTIGYGHTRGVNQGDVCTPKQALAWLREDVKDAVSAVNRLVNVKLTQGQFDALVDFVYNLGETTFQKSTLLKKLNDGKYSEIDDELKRWIRANGRVLGGLVTRRDREANLFDDEPPTA